METARFGVALAAASGLLLQSLVPPKTWAAPEPITETLLDQPSGAPAAGRLWPGFAAGKGLDTGAKAEPSGAAPAPITMSLTAPGLGADTGGDLSAVTAPLAGGVPTSGGISLGGGSPLGAGMNLPNFGNLAAGLLAPTISGIPGMPNAGGLAGLGSLGQIPGLQGLGSMMGMVGMLSILNSLPQIIGQFPQMTQQIIQSIGQMSLSMFQNPLGAVNGLAGNYQGFMGMGGQLGQAVSQVPGVVANAGAQAGGLAGSVPSQPQAPPTGPQNNNQVGGFDTDKAWTEVQTNGVPSNMCGRGVHRILTDQGYNVPPGNGKDWNENLAGAGWRKVSVSDPSQAPIGSVLVYEDSGYTNTTCGKTFGHVEVVSRDPSGNRVYLAGGVSTRPGGSVRQNWDGYAWLPPGS